MGKTIEHASLYGTDISDDENSEFMMKMFVGLLAEVITQGVSKIHEEMSKFFCAAHFEGTLEEKDIPLAVLHGIQKCFSIIQNRCVQATEELSRLVIETASQQPAKLKDFWTQELAIEMQTRLLELSKFQFISSLQEEITKKVLPLPNSPFFSSLSVFGPRSLFVMKYLYVNKVQNCTLLCTMRLDMRLGGYWIQTRETDIMCPNKQSKSCLLYVMRNSAVSMVHQSAAWQMRTCARNVQCWCKQIPKTKVPFANSNCRPDKSECSDTQAAAKVKKN